MDAKVIKSMIRVDALYHMDKDLVAEVTCQNFDEFKSLPDAIEIGGRILGKTGWSSDRNYACYKSGAMLARIV